MSMLITANTPYMSPPNLRDHTQRRLRETHRLLFGPEKNTSSGHLAQTDTLVKTLKSAPWVQDHSGKLARFYQPHGPMLPAAFAQAMAEHLERQRQILEEQHWQLVALAEFNGMRLGDLVYQHRERFKPVPTFGEPEPSPKIDTRA